MRLKFVVVGCLLLLAGCGHMGPLTLPESAQDKADDGAKTAGQDQGETRWSKVKDVR